MNRTGVSVLELTLPPHFLDIHLAVGKTWGWGTNRGFWNLEEVMQRSGQKQTPLVDWARRRVLVQYEECFPKNCLS